MGLVYRLFIQYGMLQYRMTESSATKDKTSINVPAYNKASVREAVTRVSNAVCIENMVKKNSMFAPARLEPMHLEKPLKAIYNLKLTKYKKQIQPHQARIAPHAGKSMSSLLNQTKPQFRQPRHKRNISAIWQNKKTSKDRRPENEQLPTTASFYLKKGDTPLFYQLKMDIKKVDSYVKPAQVLNSKGKYRSRNFPIYKQKVQPSYLEEEADSAPLKEKKSLQIPYAHQIIGEGVGSSFQGRPVLMKPQNHKQRYIKSTLVSYSSKLKFSKNKQSVEIVSQFCHIKNILADQINEDLILFVDAQMFSFSKNEPSVSNLNTKTASSYSLYHLNSLTETLTPIFMKESHKRVQIASITKVMTCFLVLNIARKFRLNINAEKALISERASKMPGTSAALNYSDVLTIYQLLHALMLPSGNDAAVALAEWGGKTIRKYCSIAQKYSTSKTIDTKSMNFLNDYTMERKSYQKLFIHHMNKAASILKLHDTKFANAHGLMNERAYSTSHDISLLTCIAMKNKIFAQIVSKKQFTCKIHNRTFSQFKTVSWRNTNRLLNTEGFIGVKTGVTPSAGPCLASMFRLSPSQFIVIVVLKTKSMELRFKETLEFLKESLSVLNLGALNFLFGQMPEDQPTSNSLQNDKSEQANLVQDQKELSSDQQNEEDEEEGIGERD